MGIRLSGMISGMDTEQLVSALVSGYRVKQQKVTASKTKVEWKKEIWKETNAKIYSLYTGTLSNLRFSSSLNGLKKTTVSDNTKASISADSSVANGTQTLNITNIAKASYLTGGALTGVDGETITADSKLSDLGFTGNDSIALKDKDGSLKGAAIDVTGDTTIKEFISKLKENGVSANFSNGRIFVNSKETGESTDFKLFGSGLALDALKLTTEEGAEYQKGEDCEFELNGAHFKTASNNNTINGLSITAQQTGSVTISTSTDTDGIYNKIKDFIKEYSTLINSLDSLYNASAAKGYEPLSDEEKEAIGEKAAEKYEQKIKDALLRKDDSLGTIISTLTTAMAGSVEVGGEKLSLSYFGIKTQAYFEAKENEKNSYHIDGDKDDTATSGNADKLRKLIETEPDKVIEFFNKFSSQVYDKLSKQMKSSSLRSAYNVYNDKQMDTEIKEYEDRVKSMEEKIKNMEDRYYKQFTAMEKAMAELQSKQSSLAGLLGGQQ